MAKLTYSTITRQFNNYSETGSSDHNVTGDPRCEIPSQQGSLMC